MKPTHGAHTSNTYIGAHIERVEDYRFLRGEGQYLDDISREGQWHAAFARSQIAHGVIKSIDVTKALAMPGVRAVVTAADIEGEIPTIPFRRPNPTIGPYAQPIIARGKVRYFGEPVAMVLADSPELAEDALQGVVMDIEPLPVIIDCKTRDGRQVAPLRRDGLKPRFDLQRRQGRCGRGVREGRLRDPRPVRHAAPDRAADGDARPAGGMGRKAGTAHRFGRGEAAVLQPHHDGGDDEAAGRGGGLHRTRCGRRLRRARRVLSGGFPRRVRRAQVQPSGEMDRGPARAPDGDRSFARSVLRRRACIQQGRRDAGHARRPVHQHRRLCASQRHDARAQCGAIHVGALSPSRDSSVRLRMRDEQDACGHVSRPRPV